MTELKYVQPGYAYDNPTTLTVKCCPVCNIVYAAPTAMFDRIDERGGSWWCPAGHSLHFTETKLDAAEKKAAAAVRRAEMAEQAARSQRARAQREEYRNRALKGHLTRLKRRIADGKCPCCSQTFDDVRGHIETAHAEWAAENREAMSER